MPCRAGSCRGVLLHEVSDVHGDVPLRRRAEFRGPKPDHVAVPEAIADRDPAAASTRMRELVTKALAETLEVLATQAPR